MLPALLGYPFLSFTERSRISRAALAFKRLNEADPKTDEIRLGDWLAAHGQDDRTRRVLWDLFSISSLNVPGDDASLALAAVVVKTGLLGDAGAADIGVPALSLGELHGAAAARLLDKLGASVRLSTKVAAIGPNGAGGFLVRLSRSAQPGGAASDRPDSGAADGARDGANADADVDGGADADLGSAAGDAENGEVLAADVVVLAVPHEQAARLIPAGALPPETVDGWAGLGAAPIVNLHVRYDRKVMDVPFAAAVDSPVQWVFDRTRISGLHARGDDGQYLAVSLSAADPYVNMSVAELREMFVPALAALFPEARAATVTEFFVTRERRATFRQVPGTAKLRPKSATALPGLVLAGSWTDTGWPDTMEGAVRSGLNAVIALHDQLEPATPPAASASPAAAATPTSPRLPAQPHGRTGSRGPSSATPSEPVTGSRGPSSATPNEPRGPQGPIERARGPQGHNDSAATSGTNHEISGFVPVRGAASGASAVLEADPVFEASAVVEMETVSEVNVADEDEREVRS